MKNTLSSKELKVTVDTFGAEMHSVKKSGIEYIWQADPEFWGRHAPVLFPIVGKLKNGEYTYDDKTYTMGGHGFARDNEFQLVKHTGDELIYELKNSDETLEHYPFKFTFQVSYKLTANKIRVRYTVKNEDEKIMKFGVGAHPAFNVPLKNGEFENYSLTISPVEERTFIPLNGAAGTLKVSESETVADYKKHLTHELFAGDALVYSSSPKTEVTLANNLDEHSVKVSWENMPYFGLWSPYPKEAGFVCIEPWYGLADDDATDGDLSTKFGINSLEAGKEFNCEFTIEFN
ncbi:aldose 1-epimerase family protein [Lactococcus nasutitermitis]|uniref:Aldose 1-epimerase family protein n=1 Tax=Lactococcus nasutitermitis TaxID=1652957 RepID=A0ABV9JEX5_9LACT|nr:aldose 1-epimerase family protein [Lactococcus nasutitermitis]